MRIHVHRVMAWDRFGIVKTRPTQPPLSQLFSRPARSPYRALTGLSHRQLGGLPDGRPRRYVQYSSGPLDHFAESISSAMDSLQRLRMFQTLQIERQDQAQCQRQETRRLARLQMHRLRQDLEPDALRAPDSPRPQPIHTRGSAAQRSGLGASAGIRS